MGYYKNLSITQEEDRRESMTFYIEKTAREIVTGLEIDKPGRHEANKVTAYLLIQRILQRNIDELFRVIMEEKDANENLHRKTEEVQTPKP